MARTLSENLIEALERDEHEPALKLLKSDIEAAIPFDGNAFNFSDEESWKPYSTNHSNGNVYTVMIDGQGTPTLIEMDTESNEISKYQPSGLNTGTGSDINIDDIAIVEMDDGNLGIIQARYGASDATGGIYAAIVSTDGEVIETSTQLTTYPRATSGSYGLTGLSIAYLSDGTYYLVYCYTTSDSFELYKMTSSDWDSWTGPTAIGHGLDDTDKKIEGVYIFETAENDVFLLFSYSDVIIEDIYVYNIYSMLSTDYGSTWGSATARTTYADAGNSAYGPVLVQDSSGALVMAFYERSTVLRMDQDTLGWNDSSFYDCPAGWTTKTLSYNPSTGHLTCSYGRSSQIAGIKCTCGVLVIDPENWTILDNFNEHSSPAINGLFADTHILENREECATGSKFIMGELGGGKCAIMVLDVEARSIEYIVITVGDEPYSSYGLNMTITLESTDFPNRTHFITPTYKGIALNESADTLYILASDDIYQESYYILSIDLDDTDEVNFIGSNYGTSWERYELFQLSYITIYDDDGYILLGSGGSLEGGAVVLHNLTTGAIIGSWRKSVTSGFPYFGTYYSRPTYYKNHIYFNIYYTSASGYENQRGLCDINVSTETISYIRPPWNSNNNYGLEGHYAIDTANDQLWIAPFGSEYPGSPSSYVTAARYDINTGEWTAFSSYTLQGIPNASTLSTGQNIVYIEETGNVIVALGYTYAVSSVPGIMMFNASGSFSQVKYLNAEKSGTWTWDEGDDASSLVAGTTSMNPALAIDNDGIMWTFWDSYGFTSGEYTPYWDRNLGDFNLIDYLVGEIRVRWEIKETNSLEFELSHGHLFDPQNSYSILRDIVKKGKALFLSMGENYNGIVYYENQGKFIVTEGRLNYGKRQYPTIRVRAESLSCIWKEQSVISTELYSGTSLAMITDILTTHAQLETGDYDVPTFEDAHLVEHQFVDMTVWDIMEEIADHWFYNPYDDMDGVFTMVQLDLDKSIDHVYTDNNKLIDFSPDESYSDFTNSVRVTGESDSYIDVIYAEELVGTLAGTIGWWENENTRKVSYSQDGSYTRKCRNPRLEIIQSIQYQGPLMDAIATDEGEEYISYEDPGETYVKVTIDVPDLTAAVIVSVTTMLALGVAAVGCDGLVTGGCGVVIMALTIDIAATMYILMAMANYQYEIYASPIGEEKQSIQYVANDTDHQRSLNGRIVQKDIDDSFCTSVSECRRVADGNLAIVQAQRNRIKFKKVAHLQDEILDKIRVVHPYSGENMDIFITALTRTYSKAKGSNDKNAGMFDLIEGWRLA